MSTHLILPFIAYFTVLLAVGLISYHKQTTSTDFIVGNRSLNFWVTALSAHASDMSSWLFMGFPAAVFLGGFSQAWIAIGLLMGMFLNWQLVASRLRVATEKYDSCTLSTFFERRFDDQSGVIRVVTALIAVFFLTWYVSATLIAMGGILENLFGISYYTGLIIATTVVVIYTLAGGFVAVAWTDLFQAFFLLLVVVAVPTMAYFQLPNGWVDILAAAQQKQISLSLIPDYSFESLFLIVALVLSWGLGYFGQPHIITKFMGINDVSNMKKSQCLGMTWQAMALAAATAVGIVGIAYFSNGLANSEFVFVEMVKSLVHPITAGFIFCGVLAASMSTVDSQILVSASIISEDFYKHLFKKHASSKELLAVSRCGVIVISVISLYLALDRNTTILEAVFYAWTGLGASFGPLVLMALYYKQANRYGAISGVIVGGVIAATWKMINPYVSTLAIPAMIPGFFLSILTIYIVSIFTGGAEASSES